MTKPASQPDIASAPEGFTPTRRHRHADMGSPAKLSLFDYLTDEEIQKLKERRAYDIARQLVRHAVQESDTLSIAELSRQIGHTPQTGRSALSDSRMRDNRPIYPYVLAACDHLGITPPHPLNQKSR